MSAPERVWLKRPPGTLAFLTPWELSLDTPTNMPYVPEQRALDAERERGHWASMAGDFGKRIDEQDADLAALREQVRVLTPLARKGLIALAWAGAEDSPDTAAARRIVEGKSDGK